MVRQSWFVIVSLFLVSTGFGQVIQWPVSSGGNGHYFEFVQQQLSWTDANAAANLTTFNGVQGHLATDTSAAETAFFVANYCDGNGDLIPGWLGGFQDTAALDYSEPAGGWRWVTGEPWSYTNWYPGFPDNAGGSQNYIRSQTFFRWDDFQNVSSNFAPGYYVEFVPEPVGVFPIVLGAMVLRRRHTA